MLSTARRAAARAPQLWAAASTGACCKIRCRSGKVTAAAKGVGGLTPGLTESSPLATLCQNKQHSHQPFTGLLQETLLCV